MSKISKSEFEIIKSNLRNPNCPNCGHNSRGILPSYFGAPSLDLENGLNASQTLPLVATMCPNCGKIEFYHADFMLGKRD